MYNTIEEIKEANRKAGGWFFSKNTTRGFASKTLPYIWHGKYFITSEKQEKHLPRLYTIRFINEDGYIKTYSERGQYKTSTAARKAASKIEA